MNHDVNDVNNKTQQPQLSSKIALLKQLIRKEGLLNLFRAKFSIQKEIGATINASRFAADISKMQLFSPRMSLRYETYTTLFHVKKNFGE